MENKLLILPDIHGRTFWKEPCKKINNYNKIIFLGDYLDPYNFENITVEQAIQNFKCIIKYAKKYKDKVILLLGNHDMPYFSDEYLSLANWHCRHSKEHHDEIHSLFEKNKSLFQVAYTYNNILFTHAGCTKGWIQTMIKETQTDIDNRELVDIVITLNNLLTTKEGLKCLFMTSGERGGLDTWGSCIWADYNELLFEYKISKYKNINEHYDRKQVFGHSLQLDGNPIEFGDCKMLDTRNAYELDIEEFKINKILL